MFARKRLVLAIGTLGLLIAGFQNCGRMQAVNMSDSSSSGVTSNAIGDGAKYAGTGSLSVPTSDGIVARITNGLESNVSPTAGNFARSLAAVKNNLPRNTDPSKASGFDQVQLLVYAACSDLVTGGTASKMKTVYNVPTTGTPAANKAALVAAGTKMFDNYVAGLASQGPTKDQVATVFSQLVDTVGATSANTTTVAFVSVCIAANTAGTTLMGF